MPFNTIEEKLSALAECGFKLKEQFGVSDLEEYWEGEELDAPGFDRALMCLVITEEEPPYTPYCQNLWHFDIECIYQDGDYVAIAQRMAEMAQGSLPLSDFEDRVEIGGGEAWVRFKCRGKTVHIDCAVDGDWADINIFTKFAELLAECDPSKLFLYLPGGQDCILGCATHEQFACLQRLIPTVQPLR